MTLIFTALKAATVRSLATPYPLPGISLDWNKGGYSIVEIRTLLSVSEAFLFGSAAMLGNIAKRVIEAAII